MKMIQMKKGQVAMEFMTFVGLAIFLLLLFTAVAGYYLKLSTRQQAALAGQNLALTLKSELNTAAIVEDNYNRKVRLPGQLEGRDYGLQISGREVTIQYGGNDYSELIAMDVGAGANADVATAKKFLQISKDAAGVIKLSLVQS